MFTYTHAMRPEQVWRALAAGPGGHLLDVRRDREYAAGHAERAVSLPVGDLDRHAISGRFGDAAGRQERIYLISDRGVRAEQAALRLKRAGLDNVVIVDGGLKAWRDAGLPTRCPSRIRPLGRQAQPTWCLPSP